MKNKSPYQTNRKRQHRSLTRTEYSLSKLQTKKLNQRAKTISSKSNPFLSHGLNGIEKGVIESIKKELESVEQKVRVKSGKRIISIFKKAHQASEHQTFLQKVPKQRTKQLDNEVRPILKIAKNQKTVSTAESKLSHNQLQIKMDNQIKRLLKYKQDSTITPQTKQAIIQTVDQNIEPSAQFTNHKTIESIHFNKKDEAEERKVTANSPPQIEQSHQTVYAQENNVSPIVVTTKKKFRNYQRQSQPNTRMTQQKRQQKHNKKENEQLPQLTLHKQSHEREVSFDKVPTVGPVENRQKKVKKQIEGVGSKKEYYKSVYSPIDQVDIEQITFTNAKHQSPKKQRKWSKVLENAKNQKNPYLPIESNSKPNKSFEEKNQRQQQKQKFSQDQRAEQTQGKQMILQQKRQITKQQKQPIKQQQKVLGDQEKSTIRILRKGSIQNAKLPSAPKQAKQQKSQIIEMLNKITKAHSKLEMMGQLATYFSKNSGPFKLSEQNKPFLRNSSISWHLMVYLFFKYFYYMLSLFYKYYIIASQIVFIKKQQIQQLKQQNQKWLETLNKIQKSVKKNASSDSYDQSYFHISESLKELQQKQTVIGLIRLYFLNEGKDEDFGFSRYMKRQRDKIYKQVTIFIKSLNISNILSNQSGYVYRQATFRVFNSTIILYQFHNQNLALNICQNVQQLKNPQLEQYKQYYEKLTKQILVKK